MTKTRIKIIASEIVKEHERAYRMFGAHASLHEAYAVILEELDELWEVVRMKTDGNQKERLRLARKEAIQIAAMCMKLIECIDAERWRA